MPRPPKPELIGLTDQEKRKYYARLYQSRTREKYREYQREYQLKMTHNPNHKAEVKARRIAELNQMIANAREAADALIADYQLELTDLMKAQNEQLNPST
jgi:hypothetical protein